MSSAFEGLPKTPNLKLNKPGYDNVADIEALNENADILDAEIQGIKNTFVKSVNGINAGDGGNVDLGIMPIAKGGTGASTAEQARTNLGIKDIATYDVLPIVNGGTGATTASQARVNLGLDSTTGLVPTGSVVAFAGSSTPNGYLLCDGSAVSRTTYSALYSAIGTKYGRGNGSTTFNLPNLTDKFIQGSNTVGTVKNAGLPNIKGDFWNMAYQSKAIAEDDCKQVSEAYSGAFSVRKIKEMVGYATSTSYEQYDGWSFNASRSNNIYGNSTTVQPPALTMRYIIKY